MRKKNYKCLMPTQLHIQAIYQIYLSIYIEVSGSDYSVRVSLSSQVTSLSYQIHNEASFCYDRDEGSDAMWNSVVAGITCTRSTWKVRFRNWKEIVINTTAEAIDLTTGRHQCQRQ